MVRLGERCASNHVDGKLNNVLIILQANEEVSKNLQQIKAILYGDGGTHNLILKLLACSPGLDQILYQNLLPNLHRRHTTLICYICSY